MCTRLNSSVSAPIMPHIDVLFDQLGKPCHISVSDLIRQHMWQRSDHTTSVYCWLVSSCAVSFQRLMQYFASGVCGCNLCSIMRACVCNLSSRMRVCVQPVFKCVCVGATRVQLWRCVCNLSSRMKVGVFKNERRGVGGCVQPVFKNEGWGLQPVFNNEGVNWVQEWGVGVCSLCSRMNVGVFKNEGWWWLCSLCVCNPSSRMKVFVCKNDGVCSLCLTMRRVCITSVQKLECMYATRVQEWGVGWGVCSLCSGVCGCSLVQQWGCVCVCRLCSRVRCARMRSVYACV